MSIVDRTIYTKYKNNYLHFYKITTFFKAHRRYKYTRGKKVSSKIMS